MHSRWQIGVAAEGSGTTTKRRWAEGLGTRRCRCIETRRASPARTSPFLTCATFSPHFAAGARQDPPSELSAEGDPGRLSVLRGRCAHPPACAHPHPGVRAPVVDFGSAACRRGCSLEEHPRCPHADSPAPYVLAIYIPSSYQPPPSLTFYFATIHPVLTFPLTAHLLLLTREAFSPSRAYLCYPSPLSALFLHPSFTIFSIFSFAPLLRVPTQAGGCFPSSPASRTVVLIVITLLIPPFPPPPPLRTSARASYQPGAATALPLTLPPSFLLR
ncbi:hypothetical protein DFH06DRAFT_766213, partial [Mycena polygramma]